MFRFGDTERLDSTAVRCAAAGAFTVFLAMVPTLGADVALNCLRWIGPGVLLAFAAPTWKERIRSFLLGSAAILAYAAVPPNQYQLFSDVLAGGLIGYGLTRLARVASGGTDPLANDPRGQLKRVGTYALAATAWPVGIQALEAVAAYAPTQNAVPPLVVQAAAGGVVGLLMGLTSSPLYLTDAADPITEALRQMQPTLDSELRALVMRIVETRGRALKQMIQSRATAQARAETARSFNAVALTAIELTNRFAAVDRVLSRTPMPDLEQRIAAARAQHAEATDVAVRRDLDRTLGALEEQRQQVERLIQGRARLVARLQSELASLEKTEMSFAVLASGDAALAGVQLETIGTNLAHQAHELEAEGSALQEMLTVSPRQAFQKLAH